MSEALQFQEQNTSLQNQSSISSTALQGRENSIEQKALKWLQHLKENRIFYFMVGASLLVLVVMLQIRAAYRTYDDNERLVKLWAQEKELKDFMSRKTPPDIKDAPSLDIINSKITTNHDSTDKASSTSAHHPLTKVNAAKKTTNKHPPTTRSATFSNRNSRPVAGISRPQIQAAKRWLQIKNQFANKGSKLAEEQKNYYEQKYKASQYEQLPFCIVVPSYNNVHNDLHIKNIETIIMQEYSNFHIVFIDDASTDGTGDKVEEFLKQKGFPAQKFHMIKNSQQKRAMPNLRRAAKEFCRPYEIFLIVDGDDELIGRQVLKLYNSIFQKEKSWFVYSNFLSIRGNVGYSRPFPERIISSNTYRKYPFVTSHLRAFYTQLFLNIKEEDLQNEKGEYLKAANDVAICIPILEQAGTRVTYIKELTYYYNSNTGQNNHQLRLKEQKSNDRLIRKKKSYTILASLQPLQDNKDPQKDTP